MMGRHLHIRLVTTVAMALFLPGLAFGQQLSQAVSKKAVSAVVKVGAIDKAGKIVGFGSGTFIDARGYLITNFHVIGDTKSGRIHNPNNIALIGMVKSPREAIKYEWHGRVVRADPRLDLALIRIVKSTTGIDVAAHKFPTLPVMSTKLLNPGSPVWIVGFPAGVRTVNMTAGTITGFEMNLVDKVSWLRTDAEINPGNSGGLVMDTKGRMVGIPTQVRAADRKHVVETIGFARPAERIPSQWLKELKAGHIDDTRIDGKFQLVIGEAMMGEAQGDQMALSNAERLYYQLPSARPGLVMVSDHHEIGLFKLGEKKPFRTGTGEIEVQSGDPHPLILGIGFPQAKLKASTSFWVLFDKTDGTIAEFDLAMEKLGRLEKETGVASKKKSKKDVFTVAGSIVDVTGKPAVQGLVLIGNPGIDLGSTVKKYLKGSLTKAEFKKKVRIFKAASDGTFKVTGIPRGATYPIGVSAKGYGLTRLSIEPKPGEGKVNVGVLKLSTK